jgi:predicted nucleotidyltransferase
MLGLEGRLGSLVDADQFSEKALEELASSLATRVGPSQEPLDVVVLGSLARREASGESDMDYLVVAHGLPSAVHATQDLLRAVNDIRIELGWGEPGATGMFGGVISAPDLTEKIGLEDDTNESHSRRILLLEESVSICRPDLHDQLLAAIIGRYLADYATPKKGVPRFLLNDVIRYWRTISVDYQAKRWKRPGDSKWGLRYLKLLISRKLGFAGTLASLLLCQEATVDYFIREFRKPPLERLAQLAPLLTEDSATEALREIFLIANTFAEALADTTKRDEVTVVTSVTSAPSSGEFSRLRGKGRRLQECLEIVFFESALLAGPARRYLSF